MALSLDKEMFDKNHDGKLTGSENTNWEIFWFGLGLGFGDKEDDEIYIAPKLIPDKKAAEIIRLIDKAYDQFLTNAKAILPQWDTAKQKLADRTFYHWITKGLANGVCLGYKKPGNINDPICKAYHLIVKDVLTKHPGICSYDDIVRCAKEGSVLFSDEGQLTWEKSGRFWTELILVLPCYHEDALAVFGKRVRMGYGNPDSDTKVKALEKLLQALFPMYTLFINHFDEEAAADNQKHREMFESHWGFFAGTNVQPPVRDKDITEDDFSPYLRMLLSRFPEFFEQEEHEQFKEYYWGAIQDLLCACYNDNPELAVKMWRSMYEYPFTYNNPAAHEFLDAMMENLVESDNPVALLDIIARDDSLKRLIFCSEENDNLRQMLLSLCRQLQRKELCIELEKLYADYMDRQYHYVLT